MKVSRVPCQSFTRRFSRIKHAGDRWTSGYPTNERKPGETQRSSLSTVASLDRLTYRRVGSGRHHDSRQRSACWGHTRRQRLARSDPAASGKRLHPAEATGPAPPSSAHPYVPIGGNVVGTATAKRRSSLRDCGCTRAGAASWCKLSGEQVALDGKCPLSSRHDRATQRARGFMTTVGRSVQRN